MREGRRHRLRGAALRHGIAAALILAAAAAAMSLIESEPATPASVVLTQASADARPPRAAPTDAPAAPLTR
jgi:hypothetical protein